MTLSIGILIMTFLIGLVCGSKIQRYVTKKAEEDNDKLHYEPLPCGSDEHININFRDN